MRYAFVIILLLINQTTSRVWDIVYIGIAFKINKPSTIGQQQDLFLFCSHKMLQYTC